MIWDQNDDVEVFFINIRKEKIMYMILRITQVKPLPERLRKDCGGHTDQVLRKGKGCD